jgi:hypothetical protein
VFWWWGSSKIFKILYDVGDRCDPTKIFECGPGATCVIQEGSGTNICSCLTGYSSTGGPCIKNAPVDPNPQPSEAPNTGSCKFLSNY